MNLLLAMAEYGVLPDACVEWGIRRLLGDRLRELAAGPGTPDDRKRQFIESLAASPVAVHTDSANAQHYEVPTEFYERVLGKHLKYSACLWEGSTKTLDEAEAAMLKLTCERAQLRDGMQILELGCGWGSLTLWMAGHYPSSRILAVSNSETQRRHIEQQCGLRSLPNVTVVTQDINGFHTARRFDRVVSVEMFEHMRNVGLLMRRVKGWLKPGGKLFVHIFCHREHAYLFETDGAANWMGRYFFTGGMMPSLDLLPSLDHGLSLEQSWQVNGVHYEKTLRAWLAKQDGAVRPLLKILRKTYGRQARRWFGRWRIFFLACAELFGFRGGEEWFVGHYLFAPSTEDD